MTFCSAIHKREIMAFDGKCLQVEVMRGEKRKYME